MATLVSCAAVARMHLRVFPPSCTGRVVRTEPRRPSRARLPDQKQRARTAMRMPYVAGASRGSRGRVYALTLLSQSLIRRFKNGLPTTLRFVGSRLCNTFGCLEGDAIFERRFP
jgi:hypothetical protein